MRASRQREPRQPGLDVGGDGVGWLVGVDRDQDASFGVVRDEQAGRLGEDLEPVPDHVGLVVGASALAGPVEQPLGEYRLGRVQVDRRVQCDAEPRYRSPAGWGHLCFSRPGNDQPPWLAPRRHRSPDGRSALHVGRCPPGTVAATGYGAAPPFEACRGIGS